jgi:hypothetical protein
MCRIALGWLVLVLVCCRVFGAPPYPCGDVPAEWLTKAEATGFEETGRYDGTVGYLKRLADASEWIELSSCGVSPMGRSMPLVVAAKDGHFSPESAHRAGKVVVFVNDCIHAGEVEGKDASMMLLRDIAITKQRAELLDHVVLVIMPLFNVDGHERFTPFGRINQNGPKEMGWRVTSRNLNLNRDFLKADSVEMRVWLEVWNEWQPHLHFDKHTTDGGDWQYDLTYATAKAQDAPPAVARWFVEALEPYILPGLKRDGHVTNEYFSLVDRYDPTQGFRVTRSMPPRFSTGYAAIRNRPSILVETHMLKPYRTRVIAHYNIVRRCLEFLNQHPESLIEATRADDAATVAAGKSFDPARRFPLVMGRDDESEPYEFLGVAMDVVRSDVSGGMWIRYDHSKPVSYPSNRYGRFRVEQSVSPPLAYLVPRNLTEVIDRLLVNGVTLEFLTESVTSTVESYRFENVTFGERPYEGRQRARYRSVAISEERDWPAGSALVRLDQPNANVAVHLLEPDAPDSMVSWGFLNSIFEQKEYAEAYELEGLARRMLAADPELQRAFDERLKWDAEFRGSASERLNFFYERSPYLDHAWNVYPIGRVVEERDWPVGGNQGG